MKLNLLVFTLTIVKAGVVPDTKCNGVIIDGNYYEKEILKTRINSPSSLAVDYSTNIIYFTSAMSLYPHLAQLDLNTKNFKKSNSDLLDFTHAFDQNTHDLYIGGRSASRFTNGIFKYDSKNEETELLADTSYKGIFKLFIKDVVYFTQTPLNFMYTYIDGNIAIFKDLENIKIKEFVIDSEDVMFYSNDTGLYGQKKGSKEAILYSNQIPRALTLDVHGNAYICTRNVIYKVNKIRVSLDTLMDVDGCFGLAFDKDNNIIYSDSSALYRIVKTTKIC